MFIPQKSKTSHLVLIVKRTINEQVIKTEIFIILEDAFQQTHLHITITMMIMNRKHFNCYGTSY